MSLYASPRMPDSAAFALHARFIPAWLAGFFLMALLAFPAAAFEFEVRLDAPPALAPVLRDNLSIFSWLGNQNMSEGQLRRLVDGTPAEAGDILATEGYFTPSVEKSLDQEGGAWVVHIKVQPGSQAVVGSVQVDLAGAAAESRAAARWLALLREDWAMPPGTPFSNEAWEAAKKASFIPLQRGRYPSAHVSYSRALVNPERGTVALMLTVDSGPAFSFGELKVDAADPLDRTAVERLNFISPGTPYAAETLNELQTRLQMMPQFRSVVVTSPTDPKWAPATPVEVDIARRKRYKLEAGVGFSTDTGPGGGLEYNDYNVMKKGWWGRSVLALTRDQGVASAELYLLPDEDGWRNGVVGGFGFTDVQNQLNRGYTAGWRRTKADAKTERTWTMMYQRESTSLPGAVETSSEALTGNFQWRRRDVNSLIYPTRGYVAEAQVGGASRALASDEDFVRLYGRAQWFLPLNRRNQLILRGEVGTVFAASRDGIPADFLFRTGGDQTVRGHDYQSIGIDENGAVVGGRYLVTASIEYVNWFRPDWGAAFFYDTGDAFDQLGDLSLKKGIGVGGRWRSPVGPLGVDLAYDPDGRRFRLHFRVGAWF